MVGAIFLYTKTSTGEMEREYAFKSEDWQALDGGIAEVLKGGVRLAALTGKEKEFIIGDVLVYILPLGDKTYALVLDRKRATLDWKERFGKTIKTLSNLGTPAEVHHYEKEFHLFFLWIREALQSAKADLIPPPKGLPSIEKRKLVLIGLSKAGKTSIVKKFFEGETVENALNTKPTVLRSISRHFVSFLEGKVIIHDLAGQEEFIAQHLFDESAFRKLLALMFVFDVQDEYRFPQALKYFSLALEQIRMTNEVGCVSVFMHKYDPKLRSKLLDTLTEMISKILDVASGFPLTFHPTSIFDDSLSNAIVRTMFYALPGNVLEQALTKKKLLLIHQKLKSSDDPEQLAWEEGSKIAEDLLQKWVVWAAGADTPAIKSEKTIQISVKEGNILFCLKCPVISGMRSPQCCNLTSRILAGLCQAIGIEPPIPNPPSDGTEDGFCYFIANK